MYRLTGKVTSPNPGTTDAITLTYAERCKSRLHVLTDDCRAAYLELPRGTQLRHGDLVGGPDGVPFRILAAYETVSSATTADPLLLSRACYHLGNRHVALQIMPSCVRYLHDHVLDEMVRSLGLALEVIEAPFEPESGAYHTTATRHDH